MMVGSLPSPLTGPLLLAGVVFLVAAVLTWLRRAPAWSYTFGFGAAFSIGQAGIAGVALWVQLLGLGLLLPLLVLPLRLARTRRQVLVRTLLTIGGLVVLGGPALLTLGRSDLVPPALVTRAWQPGHPLRVIGPGLRPRGFIERPGWLDRVLDTRPDMLRPRGAPLFVARQLDWWQDLRIAWQGRGKRRRIDLLLENAAGPESLVVASGQAEILELGASRKLLRLEFPPRGGMVRLRCRDANEAQGAIALLAPSGGDLALLRRQVERARQLSPALVVCFGDQVRAGDVSALLAVRDLLDGLATRVLYVPGPRECDAPLRPVVDSLFGPRDRVAMGGGVTALMLDLIDGKFDPARYPTATPFAIGAAGLSPKMLLLNATLQGAQAGAEPGIVDVGTRERLRQRARRAEVSVVIGPTDGAGFDRPASSLRQIGLGHGPGWAEVGFLQREGDAFGPLARERIGKPEGPAALAAAARLRICGVGYARPGLFRRIGILTLGVPLVLGAGLLIGRRRGRRSGGPGAGGGDDEPE